MEFAYPNSCLFRILTTLISYFYLLVANITKNKAKFYSPF